MKWLFAVPPALEPRVWHCLSDDVTAKFERRKTDQFDALACSRSWLRAQIPTRKRAEQHPTQRGRMKVETAFKGGMGVRRSSRNKRDSVHLVPENMGVDRANRTALHMLSGV